MLRVQTRKLKTATLQASGKDHHEAVTPTPMAVDELAPRTEAFNEGRMHGAFSRTPNAKMAPAGALGKMLVCAGRWRQRSL
jgi:hypothetical protein